jgi:parvulin-like peptidyl-prolyl isomerase
MPRITARVWLTTAVFALLSASAAAQERVAAPAPPAVSPTAVAATVNGQPVMEIAVQRGLERVPADRRAEVRGELINYLADNILVDQYLAQMKIAIDDQTVASKVEEIKGEIKKQNIEWDRWLQMMKLTEPELRGHILSDLRWEKYVGTQANDKVLRDLFEANKDMFNGSMVRARHILMQPGGQTPEAAEQVKAQLLLLRKQIEDHAAAEAAKVQAGDPQAREAARTRAIDEKFTALAKEKSTCPSKAQGGDVNWFPRTGHMVEPFARAAFALRPYQMSEPVKTQFGYHLILATDRKAGKDVKFEEVKEDVKDVFAERLRESLCGELRPKAKIVVLPDPAATNVPGPK